MGDWKLILGPGSGSSGPFYTEPKSEEAWQRAIEQFGRHPKNQQELESPVFVQLFNLKEDPGETQDLSASNEDLLREMITGYQRIISDGRSTPGKALSNDRDVRLFRPPPFVWSK